MPQPSKSLWLRVASRSPWQSAIAAICASNCEIGQPAARRRTGSQPPSEPFVEIRNRERRHGRSPFLRKHCGHCWRLHSIADVPARRLYHRVRALRRSAAPPEPHRAPPGPGSSEERFGSFHDLRSDHVTSAGSPGTDADPFDLARFVGCGLGTPPRSPATHRPAGDGGRRFRPISSRGAAGSRACAAATRPSAACSGPGAPGPRVRG